MKKIISIALIAALCACMLFTSCTPKYDKSPAEYTNMRWAAPDYSFLIYPDKDCTGTYRFEDTTYNIKVEFATSSLIVRDTGNSDKRLFIADWMYDENDNLYLYNIQFNKDDYKAFEGNFAEIVTLAKESPDGGKYEATE